MTTGHLHSSSTPEPHTADLSRWTVRTSEWTRCGWRRTCRSLVWPHCHWHRIWKRPFWNQSPRATRQHLTSLKSLQISLRLLFGVLVEVLNFDVVLVDMLDEPVAVAEYGQICHVDKLHPGSPQEVSLRIAKTRSRWTFFNNKKRGSFSRVYCFQLWEPKWYDNIPYLTTTTPTT